MTLGSDQREMLEEAVRLLEAVRQDTGRRGGGFDFEDARVDAHLVTALSAARAALSVAGQRGEWPGAE